MGQTLLSSDFMDEGAEDRRTAKVTWLGSIKLAFKLRSDVRAPLPLGSLRAAARPTRDPSSSCGTPAASGLSVEPTGA